MASFPPIPLSPLTAFFSTDDLVCTTTTLCSPYHQHCEVQTYNMFPPFSLGDEPALRMQCGHGTTVTLLRSVLATCAMCFSVFAIGLLLAI